MTKVYIRPHFEGPDRADGGIRRWVEAQKRLLPSHGIEPVDTEDQADLVVCHAGDLVNTSKPLVAHCHGLYNTANQRWDKWAWMLNRSVIEALRRADLITVPSRWVAGQIARGLNARAHVLYAGIEPGDWTPGKTEGYVLWNKTRVDPICDPAPVGRLASQNSHIRFISTFGDPGPNVRISGTLPYQEGKELIRYAGIYLSTTKETFGIGTLEALACEVPILGWAWGGNLDIVRHQETGYLAKPGDYDDLAAGLDYCQAHRKRLGQAGREEVLRRFTWKRAIEETAGLYQAVLEGRRQARPKVSVVVTCYDLEQYLPACLASLQAQTAQDWDCWVVDDCSPGPCRKIVEDFTALDPRIHYTRTPKNLYLAGARNHGIATSRGQYILPLDADDMLAPLALDVLSKHLDAQPGHAIAYGAMDVLEPDGRKWTSGWPGQFIFERQITHQNQLPYASMYRRAVWQRTGGYRTRCQTAEDADFWCRVSSFGFRPYRATDYPCLIKRERGDSMGHTEAEPDWTAWYPWSRSKALVPWGCAGEPAKDLSWPVQLYDPPKVSIIIPVGPGHEEYLKAALDSVQAQTEPGWECLVVNDTGQSLDLEGWPWARVLDTPQGGAGPATARNLGVSQARAALSAFLDADDYYLPTYLERTLAVQAETGGYVYTDWFQVDRDGSFTRKEAGEYQPESLLEKGLTYTITALLPTDLCRETPFDADAGGWEDWDFFFHLATKGICGTRLPEPLFTYRYWSGQRREDGYAQAEANAKALRQKWHEYITGGKRLMGCTGCGSKRAAPAPARMPAMDPAIQAASQSGMVRLEYRGSAGNRYIKGPVSKQTYKFGDNNSNRRGFVWAADAQEMLRWPGFTLVPDLNPATPPPPEAPLPVRQEGPAMPLTQAVGGKNGGAGEGVATVAKTGDPVAPDPELLTTQRGKARGPGGKFVKANLAGNG